MKMNKIVNRVVLLGALLAVGIGTTGCSQSSTPKVKVIVKTKTETTKNTDDLTAAKKLERKNKKKRAKLDKLASTMAATKKALPATTASKTKPATTDSAQTLANLTYHGEQEINVNGGNPNFSTAEMSTSRGAWESYSNLDGQNRVGVANALLSQKLMPTSDRTALTWDPTGWHNKRTAHGWLYNRSHLIGFQLSGENNNPKNLMTGTMSLNNPLMLVHEDDIAAYIHASARHYVRYQVRPIFRGNELVARGVQLRAQSVGDNTIHFNVYIFNVEDGYNIDYNTGYSTRQ
jgi:DNA-entry nuclease